jgi:Zn-dependent protease with chaperone function
MMGEAKGKYMASGSSLTVDARMCFSGKELRVVDESGKELLAAPIAEVKISSRLGNVPRTLRFPDQSGFETKENDTMDEWLRSVGKSRSLVSLLEGKLRYALVCTVITVLLVWGFVSYGMPALAKVVAHQLPDDFLDNASEFTLEVLDRLVLEPSELTKERKNEIQELVRSTFPQISASGHRLIFRRGADLGANAFALPAGVIVFTDELIELLESDDEILAVFAHEYGHVVERHSLRQILQDSAIAVLSFLIIGEATDTLQESLNAVPAALMHDAYSREFESEADDHAFRMLTQAGLSPNSLGDALRRLSEEHGGDEGLKYFSSHPPFEDRIRKAKEESR